MDNWLTVIITFRNEAHEVYNTLRSIKELSDCEYDIILINDGSDDGYDYRKVSMQFNAKYIENKESIGVASSREYGICLCQTTYFILLDAHMRAFTPLWTSKLKEELEKDWRAIFCCQTVSIDKKGKPLSLNAKGSGVRVNLKDLSYTWNSICVDSNETINIPCIMGASYAANKNYWNYLHGLKGLRSYGFDEQLISLKALLEGGMCKLIKSITFGHIFRDLKDVPYEIRNIDYIFNQLYLIELLYPTNEKIEFLRFLKYRYKEESFSQAISILSRMRLEICQEKVYYGSIFNRDFNFVIDFNKEDFKNQ
ncbi:MAG: glycosyltransferase family 2 protein [Mediterranea sp.]|jgi:glycosyltransferase involved in cell wall biosynthesis|nr:glycosyltransferase family 2 protein [Mediterranea sp.]